MSFSLLSAVLIRMRRRPEKEKGQGNGSSSKGGLASAPFLAGKPHTRVLLGSFKDQNVNPIPDAFVSACMRAGREKPRWKGLSLERTRDAVRLALALSLSLSQSP